MAVSMEQIRQLTIRARSEGVDQLTRELKGLKDANTQAAASGQALATTTESSARSMVSSARQFDAIRLRLDPVAKAQSDLEKGQRLVQRAVNDGTKTHQEAAETLSLLQQRYDRTVTSIRAAQVAETAQGAALKGSGAAHAEHAGKVELNRTQLLMFAAAAKHSAESLSAGAPFMTVLTQQGLEFSDALAMGAGGPLASLRAISSGFVGLLSPIAVATTATIAFAGSAAYAAYAWSSATHEIDQSLEGIGRRAGVTAGQLQDIAASGARSAGISTFSGMDAAAQFARSNVNGGDIEGAIDLTRRFSQVAGMDLSEATGTLAHALADPVKGFEQLNAMLGFADEKTRVLITTMAQSGDVFGAQHALLLAIANDLKDAADHATAFGSAYEWMKRTLSNGVAAAGKGTDWFFGFQSPEDKMKELLDLNEKLRHGTGTAGSMRSGRPDSPTATYGGSFIESRALRENEAEIQKLQAEMDARSEKVREKQREQDLRARSFSAARDVYATDPTLQRSNALDESISRLRYAQGNPELQRMMGMTEAQIATALNASLEARRQMLPLQERQAFNSSLELQSIQARTVAERAYIAAARELAGVRAGEIDPMARAKAAAAADRVREQASHDADERLRSARDAVALAGLPSYQRSVTEIHQRYSRQTELDTGSPEALARDKATRDAEMQALARSTIAGPIEEANRALESQNRMLAVNAATFGQTTGSITAARTQMEMFNRYMEAGIPITDAMRSAVEAYSLGMGRAAQAAEDLDKRQRLVIAGMDDIRSTSTSVFSQFLHGKSFADIGRTLADHAIDKGANFLTESLLGPNGKPGGGLLGGPLGQFLGIGAMSVGTQTVTAGVVNLGGPGLASLGGTNGVPGIGANAGATYSATPLSDLGSKAFATGYSPQTAGDRIEGGLASSRPGLDGQSMVRTLDDYRLGRSNYVTLAGNPDYYGKSYTMPAIDYASGGQKYHLENVPGYVHDTGSAFRSAPEGRFDVALGRDLNFAERNQSMAATQFLPTQTTAATQALEQFRTTTQTATTNLGGFGTGLGQMASSLTSGLSGQSSAGGGIGGFFGSLAHLFGFARGGVFGSGALMPFADGTVVGGATLFPIAGGRTGVMGEAGPEAIMPLARGADGKLGVRAAISAAASAQVHQTSVRQSVSIGGHTIIVQGNADDNAIDQMRNELDRRDASLRAWVRTSSIGTYSNQSKLKG